MNRYLLTSASFVLLLAPTATAAPLVPHRAFYDLVVKRLDSGNNISSIKGKLAYEITGSSCEGFAVSYRIAKRVVYTEGGAQVIDNQMTSFESGDGLELDLTQKQFVDSQLNSESRIKVKKDAADKPGKGQIAAAETKDFEMDATALFPTRYQLKLLEAAEKGNTRDVSLVYEGSEDEKAMRAISFIGASRPVTGLPEKDSGELAKSAAWPVSISYYGAASSGDEEPLYQASFMMLPNGISTDLVMDYGSYALSGTLSKLELLKEDACP
ncbi:MAG: DUF1849 family protein [Phyllobacteriaceae bacterium]|jgi:hypothetical protein|nr:DUF1849 family protein [Phyllobacteriaceae bacterium]